MHLIGPIRSRVYRPFPLREVSVSNCLRGHCMTMTEKEWLSFFRPIAFEDAGVRESTVSSALPQFHQSEEHSKQKSITINIEM